MPIQVAAHGFELTSALRDSCVAEVSDRMSNLALHNLTARWTLSLNAGEYVAHIHWSDGPFHGDATVNSEDMYSSILQSSKKATEQLKKAHAKRYDHNHARPDLAPEIDESEE